MNPHGSSNNITASLMDLKEALDKAAAHSISIPKEEWLAKRGNPPTHGPRQRGRIKEHGKDGGPADASDGKASVPHTCPELPGAYMVRPSDIEQLKVALLPGKDGSTSKKNKVGAHGMVSLRARRPLMASYFKIERLMDYYLLLGTGRGRQDHDCGGPGTQ